MSKTSRIQRRSLATAGIALSALGLGACSSSTGSVATTTVATAATQKPGATAPTTSHYCQLASPDQIQSTLGLAVHAPYTTAFPGTTTCHYLSDKGVPVVSLRYDTGVGTTQFASDEALFTKDGERVTPLTGLGDQAFAATSGTGSKTVSSVVVRTGSTEVAVTAVGSVDQVKALCQLVLPDV